MVALSLSLDLRRLAWSLSHADIVSRLSNAIDAGDTLLIQDLLTEIKDFPIWIPEPDDVDEGELRTWRQQCEIRGMDPEVTYSVLTILLHMMAQSEGSFRDKMLAVRRKG